ncbi:MAG: hypothetical protein R2831_10890 [Chitinophagaceae bacterium]
MTIKSKSKKELARDYNVSIAVLRSWLRPFQKKIGVYNGKTYTPKQVAIIYECLGEP